MVLDRSAIAAQLRDDIDTGRYAAGDKLPSYRQLAEMFGAAPNTVGEAVRQLVSEGLLRIKQNSPAVVRSPEEVEQERRPVDAHNELAQVRDELRDVRAQLDQIEQRVSGVLDKLDK